MVLEGCAVFVPFYTVHVWAVLAVLCGAAAGGIYTVMKRCTMVQAAQQIDRFGFQERIVTAYGRIGKEGSIDRMQRRDAVHMLQEDHAWKRRVFVRTEGNLWHFFFPLGWRLFFRLCRPPRINRRSSGMPSGRKPGKRKKKSKK